jgi:hypothetical protein
MVISLVLELRTDTIKGHLLRFLRRIAHRCMKSQLASV